MDPRGRDGRPLRAQSHLRCADHQCAPPDHRPADRRAPHGVPSRALHHRVRRSGRERVHLPPRGHDARAASPRRRPRARHAGRPGAQSGDAARLRRRSRGRPGPGAHHVGQPGLRRAVVPAGRHGQDPAVPRPARPGRLPRGARGGRRHHHRDHRRGVGRRRGHVRRRHRGLRHARSRPGGARPSAALRRRCA